MKNLGTHYIVPIIFSMHLLCVNETKWEQNVSAMAQNASTGVINFKIFSKMQGLLMLKGIYIKTDQSVFLCAKI